MERFVIEGQHRLEGHIHISGAKNAALPLMAASLLADGIYHFSNFPILRDTLTFSKLLKELNVDSQIEDHVLTLRVEPTENKVARYELVKTMRASFYVLGPLLARYGEAIVSLPGGCAWGPRPVDQHLKGLQKLGATIDTVAGYVTAKAKELIGNEIVFDVISVGATCNVLLSAVLAKGKTILENCAREPEVVQLCEFLNKMGAKISGIGTPRLEIHGVESLHPADETIIPDRIELGTLILATAITGGNVKFTNVIPEHLGIVQEKLIEAGITLNIQDNSVHITRLGDVKPVDIKTSPYPGFPTDLQAQWIAFMTIADGDSKITDTIFFDRFKHVAELQRLGARIRLDGNTAIVEGRQRLIGAPVMSTDLRASSSLVLAGLIAEGTTFVSRIYHLDRGYEKLDDKLSKLGAKIFREQEP
ncbi:MAG: UDP-N-acetylglucosamine 1-carboxyvinyltransferase [bacterium]|nr:UDP-N-acetylglucosamine 1-carboxyvinyltransferase [bacterium]